MELIKNMSLFLLHSVEYVQHDVYYIVKCAGVDKQCKAECPTTFKLTLEKINIPLEGVFIRPYAKKQTCVGHNAKVPLKSDNIL